MSSILNNFVSKEITEKVEKWIFKNSKKIYFQIFNFNYYFKFRWATQKFKLPIKSLN